MIKVESVSKTYGAYDRSYVALENIDLTIGDGEFICLLGPSGCGKSTLLNILAGFEPVSSGLVLLDGKRVSGPGQDRVMFFQDSGSALFPWLNVEENVQFGLRVRGIAKPQQQSVVDHFLGMVGLADHRRKFPSELSGGMRQRLQIARALAVDPAILLMDEPFAALDALTKRNMHRMLVHIWAATKKTVVFVTHDIAEAITLADRVAIMTQGPRSRIKDLVAIEMTRPRSPADTSFGQIFNSIEKTIGDVQPIELERRT